jgi:magnesium transporter
MSNVRRRVAPGTAPGTYDREYVRSAPPPRVIVVDYDDDRLSTVEEPRPRRNAPGMKRWIHVAGQPSLDLLEHLRAEFGLDPLALEDVVSPHQRPKFQAYEDVRFISLSLARSREHGVFDELSVFVDEHTAITFFAGDDAALEPIRKRLERQHTPLRRAPATYLAYALIDLAIDLLFPCLEHIGEMLEQLEEEVLDDPRRRSLKQVHDVRNRLLLSRRIAWATREVVADFMRQLSAEEQTDVKLTPFLQDCYDHVIGAVDLIENYRDMATSLIEVYLSVVSNRLNDTIRVLTVIATLFIPPTFVVGVYGMNFDRNAGPWSMPELGWPYGYVGVMLFMAVMMIGMFVWFRRKRWI